MLNTNSYIRNKTVGFCQIRTGKFSKITFSDVMYISIDEKGNTLFFFKNNKKIKSEISLVKLYSYLPTRFERIHKSHIVNIDYVDSIDYTNKEIIIINNTKLKFGKTYTKNFHKYFMYYRKVKVYKK